jgi:hypothetical protein
LKSTQTLCTVFCSFFRKRFYFPGLQYKVQFQTYSAQKQVGKLKARQILATVVVGSRAQKEENVGYEQERYDDREGDHGIRKHQPF